VYLAWFLLGQQDLSFEKALCVFAVCASFNCFHEFESFMKKAITSQQGTPSDDLLK
jgi:hypothetical protein